MPSFIHLLLLSLVTSIDGVNLLILGDSFDRIENNEWCREKKSTYHQYSEKHESELPFGIRWADDSLKNIHDEFQSPWFCRDELNGDTVASMMIFGAKLNGPYFSQVNKLPPEYASTSNRIHTAFKFYFEMTGDKLHSIGFYINNF
jgi:hypothetical protein